MKMLIAFALAAAAAAQVPVTVDVAPVPVAPVLEARPYGVWVHAEAPRHGHCWIWCTLPIDAPDELVGPSGIIAYRLGPVGRAAAAYGIETMAELLTPMRIDLAPAPGAGRQIVAIPLRERHSSDRVPAWAPHPAVLEQLDGIVPRVLIAQRELADPQIEFVRQSAGDQVWQWTWDDAETPILGWARVRARSPIVDCWFVARARDAAARKIGRAHV